MAESATAKKERVNINSDLENLFILFYTLKYLWKLSEHPVNELYRILFPSKRQSKIGGNKTLYDDILRLKDVKAQRYSKQLAELTGMSERYFTGESRLAVGSLLYDDWICFIRHRRKAATTSRGADLKQIEGKIKRGIREARDNRPNSSGPFGRLVYFAEHKAKQTDITLADLFGEIERRIRRCSPHDFEMADLELLENHQKVVQEYLYRIAAFVTIKQWKSRN